MAKKETKKEQIDDVNEDASAAHCAEYEEA